MRQAKILLFACLSLFMILTSCDVLQQVNQAANLTKCEFRLESVTNLSLAGVNVQKVNELSDLSLLDAGKLATAVSSQQFPLNFTLNIEAKNPNPSVAGITKIDWILLIDGIEMTKGILDQQVTIPANNGTAIIPMQLHFDLKKALSGKSADAIINFGLNLADMGNKPSRITLKMKPTITINSFLLSYPGYITTNTEFSSN